MKYNQNDKIKQMTEDTLVVGVDIASEVQYARAFDYRGIEVGKLLKFNNDDSGFASFIKWIISYRRIKGYDELVTVVGSLWDSNKLNMRVAEEKV